MQRRAALLLVAICAAVPLATSVAYAITNVQGFHTTDGCTGQSVTPHGFREEFVYLGQLDVGWGAGGTGYYGPTNAGWFSIPKSIPPGSFPGGTYGLFCIDYSGAPGFSYRTDIVCPDDPGVITGQNLNVSSQYSVMYNESWYEWTSEPWVWGTDFYQTFVATHPHITRVATRLAGKSGDHYWMNLNFAVYETNGGAPSTWTQISDMRQVYLAGTMDPIIHLLWVPYRSSDMDLVVGNEYAVRFWLDPGSQSDSFAIVARPDESDGYVDGMMYSGDTALPDWDAYGFVSGGAPGTLVNHAPIDYTEAMMATWTNVFGQTFQASGTSLAAVEIVYATGDAAPPNLEFEFQVYDAVGGSPIGPPKTCYGLSGHYQGRAAVMWDEGDIPLTYGNFYYVEWVEQAGGANTWYMNENLSGDGYINRVMQTKDMMMSIAEYITPDPMIKLSESEFSRTVNQGAPLSSDSFTVRNAGGSTLNYTITDDAGWLNCVPGSGSSTGEEDTIAVNYTPEALDGGSYTATITVSDPAAINNPQEIDVSLEVIPGPRTPAGHFKDGWNLTSVPCAPYAPEASDVYSDLVDLGNVITNNLYRYDPGAGYAIYPGDFTGVERGSGYWLYVDTVTPVTVVVVPGERATSQQTIALGDNWNMIGHVFEAPLFLSDCEVNDGVSTVSFDDAVTAGWIDPVLYYYEPGTGYMTVKADGGGDDDMLRPWYGYWLLANQAGLDLIFPYELGAISGVVEDNLGVGLVGATVATDTGGYEATTGPGGTYTISGVAPGTYDMTASAVGYQKSTASGVVVNLGRTTTQDFALSPVVNLLTNPSFELGDKTGWTDLGSPLGIRTEPWFGDIVPHDGTYFIGMARCGGPSAEGGIYQQVSVTNGETYTFGAWSCMYWYYGLFSATRNRIGIDPAGGTDPDAETIVWSDWDYELDYYTFEWKYLSVTAAATSSTVTAFMEYQQQFQNDAGEWHINCFDDCFLYEEE